MKFAKNLFCISLLFFFYNSPALLGVYKETQTLNLNHNSLFTVAIDRQSHDFYNAIDSAHLNGTLQTNIIGDDTPPVGTTFLILKSNFIVSRFSYLQTNITPTTLFQPIYSAHFVELEVVRDYLNSTLSSTLTPNEIAIGGMLNRVAPQAPSDLDKILRQIDSLSTYAEVAKAYDQISPRPSTIQANLAISEATLQSTNLIRRMQLLRRQVYKTTCPSNCSQVMEAAMESCQENSCMITPQCSLQDGRLGCFIAGNFLNSKHEKTLLQDRYTTFTTGISAGIDYEYFDNLFTGAMLGYNRSYAYLGSNAGTVNSDEFLFAIYGTGRIKKLWFDALCLSSCNNYHTERNIHFGHINYHAKGHPKGNYVSTYLGIGRDLYLYDWTIQPKASMQYTIVNINGYRENHAKALNLDVQNQFVRSAQGALGATINKCFTICSKNVMSSFRGFYVYEFFTKSPRVRASLKGSPNHIFDIHSGARDKEFAILGLSFSMLIQKNMMVCLDYDAEVARQHYFVHCFNAGVRATF